jgi:hypothetical protein
MLGKYVPLLPILGLSDSLFTVSRHISVGPIPAVLMRDSSFGMFCIASLYFDVQQCHPYSGICNK